MNILEKITERTRERIEEEKKIVPLEEVRRQAEEKGIKDQLDSVASTLQMIQQSDECTDEIEKILLDFDKEIKKASKVSGKIDEDCVQTIRIAIYKKLSMNRQKKF